jgi:hypothetical protein
MEISRLSALNTTMHQLETWNVAFWMIWAQEDFSEVISIMVCPKTTDLAATF